MDQLRQQAKNFLDEQFAIMSRHGNPPSLKDDQLEQLIIETQRRFNSLANPESINVEEDEYAHAHAEA